MNSNPTITFSLTANSLSPATSGTGGGNVLTISGEGFNKNCKVTIDGNSCPILIANYSTITCTIPSNVS